MEIQEQEELKRGGNGTLHGLEVGLARILRQRARSLLRRQAFQKGNGLESTSPFVGWRPPCNVSETDEHYRIELELPETQRQHVQVAVAARTLTIRGERKRHTAKKARDLRVECVYGAFQRTFDLPADADASSIEASFADGILTLVIAKVLDIARVPARAIEVA